MRSGRRGGGLIGSLRHFIAAGMGPLALLGVMVAGYLAYSNLTESAAACGALGDCATVHASPYGRLWGLPVSLLGFGAYAAIGLLLVARLFLGEAAGYLALLAVLVVSLSGSLFSAYLTGMEVYVIRAICPWCVASAAIISLLAAVAMGETWRQARAVPELRSTGRRSRITSEGDRPVVSVRQR